MILTAAVLVLAAIGLLAAGLIQGSAPLQWASFGVSALAALVVVTGEVRRNIAARRGGPAGDEPAPQRPAPARRTADDDRSAAAAPPAQPYGRPQDDEQPYDGPYDRQQYDGPQYDGPQYDRPQYDGPQYDRPQYDRPQYDRPQYQGHQYDGARFEGQPYEPPAHGSTAYRPSADVPPSYDVPPFTGAGHDWPPTAVPPAVEPTSYDPPPHVPPPTPPGDADTSLPAATGGHQAGGAGGAPAADDGEPPVEEVEVTDLLVVLDLTDEVLVVDEHPRYHLGGCPHVNGQATFAMPMVEARTDGFTPCGTCAPDRNLARVERARRARG